MARTKRQPTAPEGFQFYDDGLPDEAGCYRLIEAFWQKVHEDLLAGHFKTYLWLHSPQFTGWCGMGVRTNPEEVRNHLIRLWEEHHGPVIGGLSGERRRGRKRNTDKQILGDVPPQ